MPVKVKTADLDALKAKYHVVENGGSLAGGYGEGNLSSYTATAEVTENTNGLKTATKNDDGSFSFSKRATGTDSGLQGESLKKAENITPALQDASGSYGEFLRLDITGDGYGALGAKMYATTWTYYGDDSTYTKPLRTYGTKFASDNWMHKANGIQLGLTDSARCQLPADTDGTGYWKVTVYAMGYEDTVIEVKATDANIVKPSEEEADTSALAKAFAEAKALDENDYTVDSWADLQVEVKETEDLLQKDGLTQAEVDEQLGHLTSAIAALVKETYSYVYAGMTWAEYWKNEGVYEAGSTESSSVLDSHGEYDKGAFDAVTRATTNHGLHRGNYQCDVMLYYKDGSKYEMGYWKDRTTIVLADGTELAFDGTQLDHYEIVGLKYVPVRVRTSDLEALKAKYHVVENGGSLAGGYGEGNLNSYTATAEVTANTNGLKTAVKNADGSFSFSKRVTGTDTGLKDVTELAKATDIITTVKEASGSYGEFLRVDITGDGYGALGAKMYATTWTYYGNDSTRTKALRTYGTKFAADNWMHKANGIQLGLTDSVRCQLPADTDGTGYWTVTVYAMGYEDTVLNIEVTDANIVKPSDEEADTTELAKVLAQAKALKESDYTATSWADLQVEVKETEDLLQKDGLTQAEVDEQVGHLTNAIAALVKVQKADTTALKNKVAEAKKIAKGTYTTATWNALQAAIKDAENALNSNDQATVNAKLTALTNAMKALKQNTLSVSVAASTIGVGETTTVKATVSGDSQNVTWKTSNAAVATVAGGKVTAKKAGTVTITATANGISKSVTVKVVEPSVVLATTKATLYTAGTKTLNLNAKVYGVNKAVTYKTSNKKVATVSKTGVVTAKKAGTAKITATIKVNGKNKTVTCKVTVKKPSIKLKKSSATLKVGATTTIKATSTPAGKVTFKSSNKKVATVDGNGKVTAKKKGTAKITVKCNGVSKTFKVKVKK